jgi:hypothetical protein
VRTLNINFVVVLAVDGTYGANFTIRPFYDNILFPMKAHMEPLEQR